MPSVGGIDVGGTTVKAGVLDGGTWIPFGLARLTPHGAPDVLDLISAMTVELHTAHPIEAVGVAVPGIVDEATGTGVWSANLGWRDIPFHDLLCERSALPIVFGHDVRCGALAEARLGAGLGVNDVLFVPIGTGIAAGLVLNGRLYAGSGWAGELGHVDVGHHERCVCGLTGCLETIASGSAIARRYAERSGQTVTGAAEVAAFVRQGDGAAIAVWDEALDTLAAALAWSTLILAPEVLVLGGGLSRADDDLFLHPLRARLEAKLSFQRRPKLVRGRSRGPGWLDRCCSERLGHDCGERMTSTLSNAQIITADGVVMGWLRVRAGLIDAFGAGAPPNPEAATDLGQAWLAPGFVDMHVHGGGGASFQSGEIDEVAAAVAFARSHGTTTMIASLVTASVPDLVTSVRRLAEHVDDEVIAGIHLEGPFLSHDRCGAHDPVLLREPDSAVVQELLHAGRGHVAMITLAPELTGGLDAVHRIVEFGAIAALGHTNASFEITRQAIDAGATVATHLFNGMPPLHHRSPGPVLALAEDERVILELINDGVHLHPALMRQVLASAGSDRVAFITDAISMAGRGEGRALIGELEIEVIEGQARLVEGGSLAGSVLTLDQSVRNAVAAGISLPKAVHAASSTPAKALGISDRAGCIRVGAPADLVVLSEDLEVSGVMIGGYWESAP